MKINKIVFVEPVSPYTTVYERMNMTRGSALLATILKNAGYDVKVYRKLITQEFLEQLKWEADVVCISTLTNTYLIGCDLADEMRRAGKIVVMGGPHVTFETEDALKHCDFAFRGEADEAIVPLFKALEEGRGFEKITGLSYMHNGEMINIGAKASVKNIENLPLIDWSLVEEERSEIRPVMTSRGCPHDCTFCSVTAMFGKNYRFRNCEKVLDELPESGFVFYIDDNMAADRKRLKDLLRRMITWEKTPPAACQVRTEVAKDPELLDLMYKANIRTFCIGLESVNPETLKAFKKGQTIEEVERNIRIIHEHGIKIHGMFVLGSDHDTAETAQETLEFAIKNDLETVQFMILTPLPGTEQYKAMEKRGKIVNKNWNLYNAHYVVFRPENMSMYDLQMKTVGAMYQFYSLRRTIWRFISKVIDPRRQGRKWWDKFKDELWVLGARYYARNQIINWRENEENQKFLESLKSRG